VLVFLCIYIDVYLHTQDVVLSGNLSPDFDANVKALLQQQQDTHNNPAADGLDFRGVAETKASASHRHALLDKNESTFRISGNTVKLSLCNTHTDRLVIECYDNMQVESGKDEGALLAEHMQAARPDMDQKKMAVRFLGQVQCLCVCVCICMCVCLFVYVCMCVCVSDQFIHA
jgi:hypothetical protein